MTTYILSTTQNLPKLRFYEPLITPNLKTRVLRSLIMANSLFFNILGTKISTFKTFILDKKQG